MKTRLFLSTWNHLGDTVVLGAAIRNLLSAYPVRFEIWHSSLYQDLFKGWNEVHIGKPAGIREIKVIYSAFKHEENSALRGPYPMAFTADLSTKLNLAIPYLYPTMQLHPDREHYKELAGCILMNSNCQTRSMTKAYPYWQQVADNLPGEKIVLIGSSLDIDVRHDVTGDNIIDLRGRTSVSDLIDLVSLCKCVVSPVSGVVHMAACLDKPSVYLTGAKEPTGLLTYKNGFAISSTCERFNRQLGCGHMHGCQHQINIAGQLYPQCFADIAPEMIAAIIQDNIL